MLEKDASTIDRIKNAPEGTTTQIPCILVYPDQRHVKYVHQITNCLEELLPSLGFALTMLSDRALADEHFGEAFEKFADQAILGLIILDGFRPNVLFEYGYLRGKGKVILPIQNVGASIAVKSLYAFSDDMDSAEVKKRTGLTQSAFNRLKEPSVGYFRELSDRHGVNIITVDCNAQLKSVEYPKIKIKTEIQKLMPKILELFAERSLKNVATLSPELFRRYEILTLELLDYFTNRTPFGVEEVQKAVKELNELEQASGVSVPSSIYLTVASLYVELSASTPYHNAALKLQYFESAIKIINEGLNKETELISRGNLFGYLGTLFNKKSRIKDLKQNCLWAIEAYQKALLIFDEKNFPIQHSQVQNDIGIAYSRLSVLQDCSENSGKAIEAFKKSLIINTKENSPNNYGKICLNIGAAYLRIAKVKHQKDDYIKAIDALKESLSIQTLDSNDHAIAINNLGNSYASLASYEKPIQNLRRSISQYETALKLRPKEKFPLGYADVLNNLAISYQLLACEKSKNREENFNKAITALEEVLTIRTLENYPIGYAMAMGNIGNVYKRLSKLKDKSLNLKKAIRAYEDTLKVFSDENNQIETARTNGNLGLAFESLANEEDKVLNINKAVKAFEEALSIFSKENCVSDCEQLSKKLNILGKKLNNCKI